MNVNIGQFSGRDKTETTGNENKLRSLSHQEGGREAGWHKRQARAFKSQLKWNTSSTDKDFDMC